MRSKSRTPSSASSARIWREAAHAAGAYAGCQLFMEAARQAGSLDSDKLRDQLLKLKTTTIGDYAVDEHRQAARADAAVESAVAARLRAAEPVSQPETCSAHPPPRGGQDVGG